jgi:hypothetical protein
MARRWKEMKSCEVSRKEDVLWAPSYRLSCFRISRIKMALRISKVCKGPVSSSNSLWFSRETEQNKVMCLYRRRFNLKMAYVIFGDWQVWNLHYGSACKRFGKGFVAFQVQTTAAIRGPSCPKEVGLCFVLAWLNEAHPYV